MSAQLSEYSPRNSPHATDIRICILSDHEWCICDRRIPETNAESVLGYVELTDTFYEVMKLSSPRNLLYYPDFERAIESFSADVEPSVTRPVT
ncbi:MULTISPECIES: hypothetical protein [Subtercola]|uniref:Uncharacterized protein n=1 Tax=Subtercola vilae TaxID=2056433 RepID=A0A4T2BSS5_9MICO|nr:MULTISPECIES: hypothetical protein [Subtercola]MEA9986755.1 hypothetical protein [Subtercola sp. RTI3]TIH34350.1 hypothetical protein D4765_13245 [Subtercola vilae]